jgi:hypothetical protein
MANAVRRRLPSPGHRIAVQNSGEGGKRPRSGATRRNGTFFKPGDSVRETGIYEVLHDRGHRATHEAVMLAKDVFPACDTCYEKVRFRLLRTAPYIFDDLDFEEPE